MISLARIRSAVEQQSPELVLVAPPQDRAAALAALPEATAVVRRLAEPPVLDETAAALPRHADLERFAFLADEPEQDRRCFRLAWWTAVAAAVTLGAAAPILIALLAR